MATRLPSAIAALKRDPPQRIDYTLLASVESGMEAVLVINFLKPPKQTPMVVWGKFSDDKIKALTLVFDSNALRQ